MLNQAVRSLGGSMLCFKNVPRLLAWLARQSKEANLPSLPYLLLTDDVQMRRILRNLQGAPKAAGGGYAAL